MRRSVFHPARALAGLAVAGLLVGTTACGDDDGPAEVPDTDVGNGGIEDPNEGPGQVIPDPQSPQPTMAPGNDAGTPVAPDPAGSSDDG